MPYFFGKLGKMSKNLSSAAVVIGALRVKLVDKGIACQMIQRKCQAPKFLGRLCNLFVSLCRGHILPSHPKTKKIEYIS